jgi:hypothetical protein
LEYEAKTEELDDALEKLREAIDAIENYKE